MARGNGSRIGGGILIFVVAIGGLVARNADNLFRAGSKSVKQADELGTVIDSAGTTSRLGKSVEQGLSSTDELSESARLGREAAQKENLETATDVGLEVGSAALDATGNESVNDIEQEGEGGQ